MNTKYATHVAAPTTVAPDPTRKQNPDNKEPAVHGVYGYIYVADKYEGLILVGAATTIDGNPSVGNKRGGLTTIFEKSLGAIAKGGSARVQR